MPDYDLTGLSTRSFEHLVQALALEVLGPGVTPFGDGPDGGREAVFEGEVPYPSQTDRWKGYGIIQAKFRQRPLGSKEDGEWVHKQLKAELDKLASRKSARRKPDYYIFATNVVLTPVQDTGSKDKACALVQGYMTRLGLRAFRIWDYDQIRSFLDAHEDIRHAYAPFITPGDVLAALMGSLAPKRPEFEKAMPLYLQKELLADCYVYLEQAGHATDAQTPLARVFVDLPAFDTPQERAPEEPRVEEVRGGFVAHVLSEGRRKPNSLPQDRGRPQPEGLGSRLGPPPGRFVLIGGPGQGKTTVGQYICQLYRAAILRRREQARYDPKVREAISMMEADLPGVPRFPIRIALSRFAEATASGGDAGGSSLLAYISEHIRSRTDTQVTADDMRAWLRLYPWVIVLVLSKVSYAL